MLPAAIVAVDAVALAGAGLSLVPGARSGPGVAVFLLLFALLVTWLLAKVATTAWSIGADADGRLHCRSVAVDWAVGRGEILAVKGDAYGLLLVLVTSCRTVRVWGSVDDRAGLLAAIRRSNPHVQFDRYAAGASRSRRGTRQGSR
ncbi:MAG TPA: hypothetical protein VHB02_17465 [Acidimicrobiales bacterium]|nr:hypothetical protein [Acidimicrobiales bacterium]